MTVQLRIDLVGTDPSNPPALAQDLQAAFQHAGRAPTEGDLEVRTTDSGGYLSAFVTARAGWSGQLLAALRSVAVPYLKSRSARQIELTGGSARLTLEPHMHYSAMTAAIARLGESEPAVSTR